MTKNSDVLYFPNRQKNKIFEFYMNLNDGRKISISNAVNTITEFVVNEPVQVTKMALWIPKDKLANVFFYPFLRLKGSDENLIPYPYYADTKWMRNGYTYDGDRYSGSNYITFSVYGRYIGAFGIIDSSKPIDPAIIENPQEGVISYNDSNFILAAGTYEFGTYENTKDVQKDVIISHGGGDYRLVNKMYLSNDETDDYIFEKIHDPNNYIINSTPLRRIYNTHFCPNTDSGCWTIYPDDYWIFCNLFRASNNRGPICRSKDFLIVFSGYKVNSNNNNYYDITEILVSRDGKEWKRNTIKIERAYMWNCASFSHADNTGLIICKDKSVVYLSIDDGGTVTFTRDTLNDFDHVFEYMYGNVSVALEYFIFSGGFCLYWKSAIPSIGEVVYGIDSHGNKYQSTIWQHSRGDGVSGAFQPILTVGDTSYIYSEWRFEIEGVVTYNRSLYASKDGFKTALFHLDDRQLPAYSASVYSSNIYYYNNKFFLIVNRKKVPDNTTVYDIWEFGNSFQNAPTIHQDVFPNLYQGSYSQYYTINGIGKSYGSKKDLSVNAGYISPFLIMMHCSFYFKDGVISYPYDYLVTMTNAISYNVFCIKWDGKSEPLYQSGVYNDEFDEDIVDKNNESWTGKKVGIGARIH